MITLTSAAAIAPVSTPARKKNCELFYVQVFDQNTGGLALWAGKECFYTHDLGQAQLFTIEEVDAYCETKDDAMAWGQAYVNSVGMNVVRSNMLSEKAAEAFRVQQDIAMLTKRLEPQHDRERVVSMAVYLTEVARQAGLVVTVERIPLKPLAMGHAAYEISTRPLRGEL